MSTQYFYLVDADDNIYNFPDDFWLDDVSYSITSQLRNIAFAPGGRDTADRFLTARTIILVGALRADSAAALETKERALHKAVMAGGKLYRSDDVVTRFMEVTAPATVRLNYIGKYLYEKPMSIPFICEYPLWQSDTLYDSVNIVSNGDTITIDNSASDLFSYPVITVEADQGADLPSVFFRNMGDGGMTFVYQDSNFKQGDILEIDTRHGTVKRNGNSSIENVIQARFLRLQNHANNDIYYEGDDATITIEWREVYL